MSHKASSAFLQPQKRLTTRSAPPAGMRTVGFSPPLPRAGSSPRFTGTPAHDALGHDTLSSISPADLRFLDPVCRLFLTRVALVGGHESLVQSACGVGQHDTTRC